VNVTLRSSRRAASRFAAATISAMTSVHATLVEGPQISAIRSAGSPVPAPTSNADFPGSSAAASISASEIGSNIARITSACRSQYGADPLHAQTLARCSSRELKLAH